MSRVAGTFAAAALLAAAAVCAAEGPPGTSSAPATGRSAAETRLTEAQLPPEPPWLTATGIAVMIAGGCVLTAWAAIKRRRALDLPPLPKADKRRITPAQALGGLCLWVLLGALFAQGTGRSLGVSDTTPPTPAQTVQMIAAGFVGQVLAAAAILYMLARGSRIHASDLGIRLDGLGRALGVGLLVLLAVYPLCYGLWWLIEAASRLAGHEPSLHPIVEQAARSQEPRVRYGLALLAAVGAPLVEEFFFRGFAQTFFRQQFRDRRVAVLLAAGAFALVHFANWEQVPSLFVLGLGLGWAYEKTGRLAAPALCHMLFNGMTMLRFF